MSLGKFLLFVLVAFGITGAVLYWQQDHLPFKLPKLPSVSNLPKLNQSIPQLNQLSQNQQLQSAGQQAQEQFQATSEKFQTVTGNVQQVLGAAVQVNENESKSAPEKALDYGKYLYCKQVVNEYEAQKRPSPVTSPIPSPTNSPAP